MTKAVKIYGLVNPFNNRVFYVGATRFSLEKRLMGHKAQWRQRGRKGGAGGTVLYRRDLDVKAIEAGKQIRIKLLEEVVFSKAQATEHKWFLYYKKFGSLLQSFPGSYCSGQPLFRFGYNKKNKSSKLLIEDHHD